MSLLLDALKKAAEEKQRVDGVQPPVRPRPQSAEAGGQNGTQLMNLLQGKDQGHELDNVAGFEPFGDEAEGKSGFSLSLIDEDDESLDKLGFKEQPLPEPEPEPEPAFTLELLDDNDEPPAAMAAASSPAASMSDAVITNLTLLDDDEPVPVAAEMAPPVPGVAQQPEVASVTGDTEATAAGEQANEVPPDNTVDMVEAEQAPAPDVEPVPASTTAEVVAEVPPLPVVEAPERPAPTEPAPEVKVHSPMLEAAPEMVLDALQRRRRRRRVLILSLLLSVGLAAGGWGFLMYEEQLQRNDQLLSRYRLPANPRSQASSDPMGSATTTVAAATRVESSVAPATISAAATQTAAPTVIEPETQVTEPAVDATDAVIASAATAVEAVLEQDRAEHKSGSVTLQGNPASDALQSVGSERIAGTVDSGRVTVKRTLVDKGILEQGSKLGIERRRTEARVLSAYRAFRDGDLKTALKLYQQALAEDPFSRDAVMGLAAIAATERDYAKAAYYYKQLLDYDPTDGSAFEGLVGLPDSGLDLVDMESRLRNYLSVNPDSVRGQARLGRVMARQKRWHEAQDAFFNAHRLDPDKAAYALNVAIALDHLRKYSAARRYYEQAVMLASRKGVSSGINLASARQRLDALSRLGK